MRRRDVLKLAACAAVPAIWIPKLARAATPGFGSARHLLILFAKGGFRSHATFNAVGTRQHNPFGTQPAAPGTAWTLGAACAYDDLPTTRWGPIPAFSKIANDVAVLASVDHTPGAPVAIHDHDEAIRALATGDRDGALGLLTIIGAHYGEGRSNARRAILPPAEIRASSAFGSGEGRYAIARPLSIFDPTLPPIEGPTARDRSAIAARTRLDDRFARALPGAYAARLTTFLTSKRQTYLYADALADPVLDVAGRPDLEARGFSNGDLLEILGQGRPKGAEEYGDGFGAGVALALRLFELGAPACVVAHDAFDLHYEERNRYGPLARDLVRQLAGLDFILRAMPHEDGGSFWDHTVVAAVSEFSRNHTFAETGFNSAAGSDHRPEASAPMRNQAVALLGGPITARGRLIGATDESMNAIGEVFSTKSLLATFLDLLGVDPAPFFVDPPIRELVA
jgi:uncharacterized protein DUF1501